jgi:D-amino peptidase
MKFYISADIEGVTGITSWDETEKTHSDYRFYQEQMTAEVNAACLGALEGGATEILIKDAHDSGRNLLLDKLPREARVIRGWSGSPLSMVQELDDTFFATAFIGYHSGASLNTNPLSHTMSSSKIAKMIINDRVADEFYLHALYASKVNAPVVFVSGDKDLCNRIETLNKHIVTVATVEGIGNSSISTHPEISLENIKTGVIKSISNSKDCFLKLPKLNKITVQFKKHQDAYFASFYPGAKAVDSMSVCFEDKEYFNILRFVSFIL